ncbi:DUF1942 domain-containing protein [Gordonia sp. NPDC003429]
MRYRTRIIAVCVAVTGATGLLAGCADTDSSATQASGSVNVEADTTKTFAFGTAVDLTYQEDAARVTVSAPTPAKATEWASVDGVLYSVMVTVQTTEGTWTVNPAYLSATTNTGQYVEGSLGTVDGSLEPDALEAGQTATGAVAFDVPEGQTITSVALEGPVSKRLAQWD